MDFYGYSSNQSKLSKVPGVPTDGRKKMKFSIRYKFAIGLLFVFCLSFSAMSFFMNKIVMENNRKVISDELLNSQRDLNIYFKQFLIINKIDINQNDFEKHGEGIADGLAIKMNNKVVLYKNNGSLLFDSDYGGGNIFSGENVNIKDSHEDLKLAIKGKSAYSIVKQENKYYAAFSQPLYGEKTMLGVLRYTKDYTELFQAGDNLLLKMKVFMVAVFFMIFIFALLLATKITVPIIKLNKITKEISNGNFDINIGINSNDEVGELGESFNIMKGKIKNQILTIEKDRDDLLKAQSHRKVFFDNVTHEMKTPLTIIDGYSQMILDEGNKDEQLIIKAASKVKKESNKLHNMITDILCMSKAESSVDASFLEKVNMDDVIRNICDDMSVKAKRYEISILRHVEEDIYVLANRDEISRMLINLIDNSIKYGKVKSIIDVKLYKKNNNCIITVEDKGKGIQNEELQRIFEPFYRVDKDYSRQMGGNGLGLSIVKSIVDKYEGSIDIESKINEGTKIIIKIPLFLQVGNNLVNLQ